MCPNNCTNHGKCDFKKLKCVCEDGYADSDCSIAVLKKKPKKAKKANITSKGANQTNQTNLTIQANKTAANQTNQTNQTNVTILKVTKSYRVAETPTPTYDYMVGPNNTMYLKTDDCSSNCSLKGVCLNSTCFCEQGYTTDDCSLTYKEYGKSGFEMKSITSWSVYAFAGSIVATFIILILAR